MNFIIFTEGGRNMGFGHITRCIGLYEGLKMKKFEGEILVNGDESVDFILKKINYKKINWLNTPQILKRIRKNSIVIVDSYLAPISFYNEILKIKSILPIFIDDYKRLVYPGGIVVNPTIYGDKLKYKVKKNIIYLLGKNYIILRKEFWKNYKKKLNKNGIKTVLLTFGGIKWKDDFRNNLLNYLSKYLNFTIISFENFSVKKIINAMLKSDICISGGGQTTYELTRIGIPIIGVCFSESQILNLKFGEKYGYLKFAGWYNEKNICEKVLNLIKNLQDEELIKMSKIGKKIIDGKGVKRIIKKIWKLI